jgi:hypothetical protein
MFRLDSELNVLTLKQTTNDKKNWSHQTDVLKICLTTNLTEGNTQEQIHYNQESPPLCTHVDGIIICHNAYYLYDNQMHAMALKSADWVTGH